MSQPISRRPTILAVVGIAATYCGTVPGSAAPYISTSSTAQTLSYGYGYEDFSTAYDSRSGFSHTALAAGTVMSTVTPTNSPTGLTAITVGTTSHAADVLGQSLVTNQYVNLKTGKLGSQVVTSRIPDSIFGSLGSVTDYMQDGLTFHVAGGGSAFVTLTSHLDGVVTGAGASDFYASYSNTTSFGIGSAGFGFNARLSNGGASGFATATVGDTPAVALENFESYRVNNVTLTGYDFSGVLKVTDGEHALFQGFQTIDCRSGAACDFLHTATFGLSTPTGTSFTSDSGVFLTGTGTVGGVPEPASWAMLGVGFGVIGVSARRRQRRVMA